MYVATLLLVTGLSKTAVAPEPNVYLISSVLFWGIWQHIQLASQPHQPSHLELPLMQLLVGAQAKNFCVHEVDRDVLTPQGRLCVCDAVCECIMSWKSPRSN